MHYRCTRAEHAHTAHAAAALSLTATPQERRTRRSPPVQCVRRVDFGSASRCAPFYERLACLALCEFAAESDEMLDQRDK